MAPGGACERRCAAAPLLPGVLAEIAGVAGREAALAIALARGGDDGWDVPRSLDGAGGRDLAALIGPEAAEAVVRRLGGGPVSVPMARRAVGGWLSGRGFSTPEIAAALGVTRRAARRYRRAARR